MDEFTDIFKTQLLDSVRVFARARGCDEKEAEVVAFLVHEAVQPEWTIKFLELYVEKEIGEIHGE